MGFFCLFAFSSLGPHVRHVEVPRLVVKLNQSCSFLPTPQPQQCGIPAVSVTCTTVHSNTRSLTHWVRQGIEQASSKIINWAHYCWATMETPTNLCFLPWFLIQATRSLLVYKILFKQPSFDFINFSDVCFLFFFPALIFLLLPLYLPWFSLALHFLDS